MKYIDADKLLAEIERRKADAKLYDMSGGDAPIYDELLSIISSLQQEQPKVDLGEFDKDVTKIWGRCAAEPNDSIACLHIETFNEVARHFYELGLKAREEE